LDDLLRLERDGTDEDLSVERIQADEELGARDLILAMVSHDLRNLLGSMALHTEFMLRDLPADDNQRSGTRARAARIQRSVARMNRPVGDLMDIAR
jgi:signal transduction histidine kinase